jgi:hypothetical protein
VQKYLASVLVGDETEAFVGVEPLDLAGGHCDLLLCLSELLGNCSGICPDRPWLLRAERATWTGSTRLPGRTVPRRMH